VINKEEDIKLLTEPAFLEGRSVVISSKLGWGLGELLKAIRKRWKN
jgi:GTP-binding protein HflX